MRWIILFIFLLQSLLISAQFDTIASSWSMWSAWSACAPEGVMIRVRACSTVKGFKCVGRNKEFKSCELKNSNGDQDFDQLDEDRQIAIKQLYQDYDLHADSASVSTKKPSGLQYLQQNHQVLPPGHNVMAAAPPGHSKGNTPMPREETVFKGSFKSTEEDSTSPVPMEETREPAISSNSHWANSGEELMEEEEDEKIQTTPVPPSTPVKRRYKAKYVTQGPIIVPETSTTTTTTTTVPEDDEEVELNEDEEQNLEQNETLPDLVNPTRDSGNNEEEETPVSVVPETTERPTERTTPSTTIAKISATESTPPSFPIHQETAPEDHIPVHVQPQVTLPKRKMKIHGRTMVQQLPTMLGMNPQAGPLGMLPPTSPPRAIGRILHNGQIDDVAVALKEGRRRLRKLRKNNRRRMPISKAAAKPTEQLVTGDTALALSWLIANMTQSTGDESLPLSDRIILEKYIPKEPNQPEIKWSQWSLWSECRCGLQRRKRICLPSSRELLQDVSKCPLPEFQERTCLSDYCQ